METRFRQTLRSHDVEIIRAFPAMMEEALAPMAADATRSRTLDELRELGDRLACDVSHAGAHDAAPSIAPLPAYTPSDVQLLRRLAVVATHRARREPHPLAPQFAVAAESLSYVAFLLERFGLESQRAA